MQGHLCGGNNEPVRKVARCDNHSVIAGISSERFVFVRRDCRGFAHLCSVDFSNFGNTLL